jgi:hypothetical protein
MLSIDVEPRLDGFALAIWSVAIVMAALLRCLPVQKEIENQDRFTSSTFATAAQTSPRSPSAAAKPTTIALPRDARSRPQCPNPNTPDQNRILVRAANARTNVGNHWLRFGHKAAECEV